MAPKATSGAKSGGSRKSTKGARAAPVSQDIIYGTWGIEILLTMAII